MIDTDQKTVPLLTNSWESDKTQKYFNLPMNGVEVYTQFMSNRSFPRKLEQCLPYIIWSHLQWKRSNEHYTYLDCANNYVEDIISNQPPTAI